MQKVKLNVAVVGGHSCAQKIYKLAEELGRLIAQEGWTLICGGKEGVMEAACRGAKAQGGLTVGILPSLRQEEANAYVDIRIPTGLGYARNALVARAAEVVIALAGECGTLSEIAFALSEGKTVLGIETWDIKGVKKMKTPQAAITYIKKKINPVRNRISKGVGISNGVNAE